MYVLQTLEDLVHLDKLRQHSICIEQLWMNRHGVNPLRRAITHLEAKRKAWTMGGFALCTSVTATLTFFAVDGTGGYTLLRDENHFLFLLALVVPAALVVISVALTLVVGRELLWLLTSDNKEHVLIYVRAYADFLTWCKDVDRSLSTFEQISRYQVGTNGLNEVATKILVAQAKKIVLVEEEIKVADVRDQAALEEAVDALRKDYNKRRRTLDSLSLLAEDKTRKYIFRVARKEIKAENSAKEATRVSESGGGEAPAEASA